MNIKNELIKQRKGDAFQKEETMFKGRVKRKLQLILNDWNLGLGGVEVCEKSH